MGGSARGFMSARMAIASTSGKPGLFGMLYQFMTEWHWHERSEFEGY
jgi:hypothetical protein